MDLKSMKVSSTVIVISKDRKALIVQRPPDKAFANLWTVAGGKLQDTDGVTVSKTFKYLSSECCAVRELEEETGIYISIKDVKYLCSIYAGEINRLILSYYVVLDKNADEIEIKLSECQAYKWITRDEIKNYHFIPDIGGEIKEVFDRVNFEDWKNDVENFKTDCLAV